MPDIFISYSRKDSAQAEQLAELLSSAGLSVWIDKSGIDIATSWSGEIVDAINECKAFVVLLSPNSLESHNVIKEVSLASEKRKKILPLDLEPVALTRDFEYQLAGIQRAPMTNIDAVIRALGKLGLAATQAPSIKLVHETDARKSLMILPFEDLSPTADNAWFADGIVSELISALSNVKALRVMDAATTKEFKGFKGHLTTYASEMRIRYFVQGDVRKFGDSIKITSRLLDIETGDHLWQDSMKGTMNDIFDIQEKVAEKVVEGLNIFLSKEEKSKLDERGTENAEAYEYYIRARELDALTTREGFLQAISLLDLAIKIDPHFVNALLSRASAMILLYKNYECDPTLLSEAQLLLQRAEELKPGGWEIHNLLAGLYLSEGRVEDAERENQEHITKDDGSASSQSQLGYFSFLTKQYPKAFEYYEASLKIDSSRRVNLWNVIVNAYYCGNIEGLNRWSNLAIAAFQKQLRFHPEDTDVRQKLAATYFWSNPPRRAEALQEIYLLESLPDLDYLIQYQIAWLLVKQREDDHAIESLRKAIGKGFANFGRIWDADSAFAPLFGNPAFEVVMKQVEVKQNV
jgi:adenylate cyclase